VLGDARGVGRRRRAAGSHLVEAASATRLGAAVVAGPAAQDDCEPGAQPRGLRRRMLQDLQHDVLHEVVGVSIPDKDPCHGAQGIRVLRQFGCERICHRLVCPSLTAEGGGDAAGSHRCSSPLRNRHRGHRKPRSAARPANLHHHPETIALS
jgi:hypothetical protein